MIYILIMLIHAVRNRRDDRNTGLGDDGRRTGAGSGFFHPVSLGFKLPAYKLTAIRDNLRMMIYPYKNLKRQALQIGVISQLPIATRYAYITGMQNILNKDHNVVVSDFVAHNHYDLIISDFELTEPQQFHTPILTLDDLNIQSNLTLLEKTIAKLESERYQPLILQ